MSYFTEIVAPPMAGSTILARLNALGAAGAAFTDSVFAIVGSSDSTKTAVFEVDGFTSATTRTFTLPNATGTLAILGLAQTWSATQTFAGIDATSIGATTRGTGLFTTLGASGVTSITNNTAAGSASGALVLSAGGAYLNGGVRFGSGSTTLNYYEEGTFTPTLAGSTTAGTHTYSLQAGRYTRIGNRVFFQIDLALSAYDGTAAGSARIRGLPFTSANNTGTRYALSFGLFANITLTAGKLIWMGEIDANSTEVRMREAVSAGGVADQPVGNWTTNSEIHVSGFYEV